MAHSHKTLAGSNNLASIGTFWGGIWFSFYEPAKELAIFGLPDLAKHWQAQKNKIQHPIVTKHWQAQKYKNNSFRIYGGFGGIYSILFGHASVFAALVYTTLQKHWQAQKKYNPPESP